MWVTTITRLRAPRRSGDDEADDGEEKRLSVLMSIIHRAGDDVREADQAAHGEVDSSRDDDDRLGHRRSRVAGRRSRGSGSRSRTTACWPGAPVGQHGEHDPDPIVHPCSRRRRRHAGVPGQLRREAGIASRCGLARLEPVHRLQERAPRRRRDLRTRRSASPYSVSTRSQTSGNSLELRLKNRIAAPSCSGEPRRSAEICRFVPRRCRGWGRGRAARRSRSEPARDGHFCWLPPESRPPVSGSQIDLQRLDGAADAATLVGC